MAGVSVPTEVNVFTSVDDHVIIFRSKGLVPLSAEFAEFKRSLWFLKEAARTHLEKLNPHEDRPLSSEDAILRREGFKKIFL